MPRRNKRESHHLPLDLTPAEIPKVTVGPLRPGGESPADRRVREERERAARQREARIQGGIDWTVCLVPGCGHALRSWGAPDYQNPDLRNPEQRLPMCTEHALIVWQNVQMVKHESFVIETNEMVLARTRRQLAAEAEANKRDWLSRTEGSIYFVRVNGLVKVGWSRDVNQRLRSYGPNIEVLCIYPATHDDETNLHRQLRPALARGREWYEDGRIVGDFVAAAVEKHGPPHQRLYEDTWTKPKATVKPHRSAR